MKYLLLFLLVSCSSEPDFNIYDCVSNARYITKVRTINRDVFNQKVYSLDLVVDLNPDGKTTFNDTNAYELQFLVDNAFKKVECPKSP